MKLHLSQLSKGDIFKFGNKPWDALHRFHSLYLPDNGLWYINMMSPYYNGSMETCYPICFTHRDEDIEVYIPKFYLSEQKRTRGLPCIPHNNARDIIATNLNSINLSDKYCSHDKYWYDIFIDEDNNTYLTL